MKICLNMIVKNESKIITRLFDSLVKSNFIDYWVICDTGSTDDTVSIIEKYFLEHNISGKIIFHEWVNFGLNRTFSLLEAQKFGLENDFDYILFLDADMILVVGDKFNKNDLTHDVYYIKQGNTDFEYYNVRLVKRNLQIKCVSPTHEYYDIKNKQSEKYLNNAELFISDIGDGGSKQNKFKRDIILLKKGIIDEPDNPRYYFYLGQSYYCIDNYPQAIKYYELRIGKGGWSEEIWYSYFQIGNIYNKLNEIEKAIYNYMQAYSINPSRVENIAKIVPIYRNKGNYILANFFIDMGINILKNNKLTKTKEENILFKEIPPYTYIFLYEKSIVSYYLKNNDEGFKLCNYLILNKNLFNINNQIYNTICSNVKFYITDFTNYDGSHIKKYNISNLKNICDLNSNFQNLYNPSIYIKNNKFMINFRVSNYDLQIINNNLVYKVIKNDDIIDISHENPVITKNVVCNICNFNNFDITDANIVDDNDNNYQQLITSNSRIKGIEDLRFIYDEKNSLTYFIGNSQEISLNTIPKLIIGCLENNSYTILKGICDNLCQKNWSPFFYKGKLLLVYSFSPLIILEPDLKTGLCSIFKKENIKSNLAHLKGGSQGFYIGNYLYFITHEVLYEKGRIYFHRFVKFNSNLELLSVSVPFYMKSMGIEYVAGAVYYDNNVYISWGSDDKNSNISKISIENMNSKLFQ